MVQVAVEIQDGCEAAFIEPIKIPKIGETIWLTSYRGVVTKTIKFCGDNIYNIEVPQYGEFRVVYWRVIEFTFGGVWLPNRKFDQIRIDNQIRRLTRP